VFEPLEEDGLLFCYIPQLQGAWAKAANQAACLTELAVVLEEWILFRLRMGQSIPTIDGHSFEFPESSNPEEAA
jgi:hypothetical protein